MIWAYLAHVNAREINEYYIFISQHAQLQTLPKCT